MSFDSLISARVEWTKGKREITNFSVKSLVFKDLNKNGVIADAVRVPSHQECEVDLPL